LQPVIRGALVAAVFRIQRPVAEKRDDARCCNRYGDSPAHRARQTPQRRNSSPASTATWCGGGRRP